MTEQTNLIRVKRITTNAWLKDINLINSDTRDKVEGSFKGADGSRAKTSITLGIDKLTGHRKILLTPDQQQQMETEIGFAPGTLAPSSRFWVDFSVDIQGTDLLLYPDIVPIDKLKILLLKSKPFVADGLEELKTNAYAEYVILSQVEEAKKANKARDVRKKAYSALDKMSKEEMADVLIAMGKKPTGMSLEMIEDNLGKEVESNPSRFLAIYTNPKFQEVVYINKLINNGILVKRGDAIVYEEDVLGYDISSAIDYLKNPENKIIFTAINSAYEGKANKKSK